MRPAIIGIAGAALTGDEAALFRAFTPAGVILFRRNVEDPAQLRALTDALRAALPATAVLMVDQEGGRVARLRPPHWRAHPPAASIGELHAKNPASGRRAAWLTGALVGIDCTEAGLDTVCAPVLDLRFPATTDAIGDRSYGVDPAAVAALGRAMADGLLAAGIQPVGKHAPGHGRAEADSHLALPTVSAVDLTADIGPFAANADLPWLMTAHILYERLDPDRPATLSPDIIARVIRGTIGFQGVLVTDDLTMNALSGNALSGNALAGGPGDLAAAAIDAGCDIALHCSGELAASEAVLRAVPPMPPATAARLAAARALAAGRRIPLDAPTLATERDRLLGA